MNKKGFTLVELLIVVAIIGIIAAIAIPNLLVALQKGKQKATMGDMKTLGTAVESYITDWSFSPGQGAGNAQGPIVDALDESWFRPFYIKVMPLRDGWGYAMQYVAGAAGDDDQDAYSVISYGRNMAEDNLELGEYEVMALGDFNQDIVYSNGQFTTGPRVKR